LYGYDAHRNIAFLTDATGAITDTYTYDGWGNLVPSTGSTVNTHLYAGQEFDSDLGLIDLRARQYRPSTGRFLNLDPLAGELLKPTSLNRYLYADADPINLWDPKGMQEFEEEIATDKLTAAVIVASLALVSQQAGQHQGRIASIVSNTAGADAIGAGLAAAVAPGSAGLFLGYFGGCAASIGFYELQHENPEVAYQPVAWPCIDSTRP
jgi:RHS repeat-associated protein